VDAFVLARVEDDLSELGNVVDESARVVESTTETRFAFALALRMLDVVGCEREDVVSFFDVDVYEWKKDAGGLAMVESSFEVDTW
jgi:hypothetical protein